MCNMEWFIFFRLRNLTWSIYGSQGLNSFTWSVSIYYIIFYANSLQTTFRFLTLFIHFNIFVELFKNHREINTFGNKDAQNYWKKTPSAETAGGLMIRNESSLLHKKMSFILLYSTIGLGFNKILLILYTSLWHYSITVSSLAHTES